MRSKYVRHVASLTGRTQDGTLRSQLQTGSGHMARTLIRKTFLGVAAAAGAVVLTATAAFAAGAIITPVLFASWPGPYCATGGGEIQDFGASGIYIRSSTYSWQGATCGTASPAAAGIIAAQAVLMRQTGGVWGVCSYGPHAVNGAGSSSANSMSSQAKCGAGNHRVNAQWRITYGGSPNYGNADSAAIYVP